MKSIYIVLIVLILLIAGSAVWYFGFKNKESSTPATNSSSAAKSEAKKEDWVKNSAILFPDVTSTDTHKLADGTFRMYFQQKGKIVYADSKDATTFESPKSTGVSEEVGKFLSNPAVIKISEDNWLMVYEEQPMQQPGQKPGPPGAQSQRNLMLATSKDGQNFTKAGLAIDSSKDDNYFASVPDLIQTPDGKIRMYYVCGGEATCSTISADGKTWAKEAGVRMQDKAVDPDVGYKNGQWTMYFSTLTGDNNSFFKATSKDGLTWAKNQEVLKPQSAQSAIVDPDVVEISPNKWRMFFGEMQNGEAQFGGPATINLYYADFSGDIFS